MKKTHDVTHRGREEESVRVNTTRIIPRYSAFVSRVLPPFFRFLLLALRWQKGSTVVSFSRRFLGAFHNV